MEETDKKTRILKATLKLITDNGFHGTPVSMISSEAGVGAGTIYRYFESKEALANSLFKHWRRALDAYVFDVLPFDAPLRHQFHVYWQRMAEFTRRHSKAVAYLRLSYPAPYLDAECEEMMERALDRGREFCRKADEQQITRPLPADLLIFVFDGIFDGMVCASEKGLIELNQAHIDAAEECAWAAICR